MKKTLFALLAIAGVLVSCSKTPTEDPKPADSVSLNKTAVELEIGATETLVATANNELTVAWASSAEAVATVKNGVVTAVAEGEATITATAGTASATCKVTVTKPVVAGQDYAFTVDYKSAWAIDVPNPVNSVSAWTVEVRFRKNGAWHTDGISNRMITVGDASEKGIMMRFNDDGGKHVGDPDAGTWGLLQVCSLPSVGNFYMGRNDVKEGVATEAPQAFDQAEGGQIELYKFMQDEWYTVSFSMDGDKLYVYVNGELAAQINDAAYTFSLQRIDLGMVWSYGSDGHDDKTAWPYKQSFDGDIAYVRFWTKACTQADVKANLCGVANDAEGLEMNLAFSEGDGTMIADKTGKGHDFDFTKAYWTGGACDVCPNPADICSAHWNYVETICAE